MAFECTQCGLCCTNLDRGFVVIALQADRQKIADHLGKSLDDVEQEFFEVNADYSALTGTKVHQAKSISGSCIFLNEDRLCSIHAFKPFQCKHGPERFFSASMADAYECMKGFENQADAAIEQEFFDQLFEGG